MGPFTFQIPEQCIKFRDFYNRRFSSLCERIATGGVYGYLGFYVATTHLHHHPLITVFDLSVAGLMTSEELKKTVSHPSTSYCPKTVFYSLCAFLLPFKETDHLVECRLLQHDATNLSRPLPLFGYCGCDNFCARMKKKKTFSWPDKSASNEKQKKLSAPTISSLHCLTTCMT